MRGPAHAAGGRLPGRDAVAPVPPSRVGLWLAAIVLGSLAVFSLGVMVGKRVAESVPRAAAPPEALPTETIVPVPLPAAEPPAAAVPPEKMSFYESLSGRQARGPIEVPESPPPVSPGTAAEAPEPAAASPAPAPETADPLEGARALVGRGAYRVQVLATPQREAAEQVAARFKLRGFEVSTGGAVVKGRTWYRVRVGTFADATTAARAAAMIRESGIEGMVVRE